MPLCNYNPHPVKHFSLQEFRAVEMSETETLSIYPYEPHEEYSLRGPASTALVTPHAASHPYRRSFYSTVSPHAASHPGGKAEAEEKVGWTPEVVLTVFTACLNLVTPTHLLS